MKKALVAALLLSVIPLACFAQQWNPDPIGEARRINELAASDRIRTEQDARNYVDALAHAFGDHYGWFTSSARHKLAHAEYLAIHDNRLVSDERLAKAVNDVNDAMGAPAWARMNAAEVRNYRDANLTGLLHIGIMPIHLWHMPNIVARSKSGGLADGSRPVEALYTLYLLTDLPYNLISAKDREEKGQLASLMVEDAIKHRTQQKTSPAPQPRLIVESSADARESEIKRAEYDFLRTHKASDINNQILRTAERLVFGD